MAIKIKYLRVKTAGSTKKKAKTGRRKFNSVY